MKIFRRREAADRAVRVTFCDGCAAVEDHARRAERLREQHRLSVVKGGPWRVA